MVTLYRESNKWDAKLYKLKVKKQVNNASVTIARATIDLSELAQLNEVNSGNSQGANRELLFSSICIIETAIDLSELASSTR